MTRFLAPVLAVVFILAGIARADENLAITDPPHNAWVVEGIGFPLFGIQQVLPGGPGQVIALQYATSSTGPWTLADSLGSGAPVECEAWCYTTQGFQVELELVVVNAIRWVRIVTYTDQSLPEPPVDWSAPIRWRLRKEGRDTNQDGRRHDDR